MARLSSLRHSCQHLYQHPKNIGVWGGFDTILKVIASNSFLNLQTVTSSEGLPVLKVSPLGANKVNILPKPILHHVNQSFLQHYMKWNNYWDSFLVNGIIPFLVLAVCNARLVNNKTEYFDSDSMTLNCRDQHKDWIIHPEVILKCNRQLCACKDRQRDTLVSCRSQWNHMICHVRQDNKYQYMCPRETLQWNDQTKRHPELNMIIDYINLSLLT